jgi:hypothetical protein
MSFLSKILLIGAVLGFGQSLAAQTGAVTSDIFYEKYAQVMAKSSEIPRRRIQKAEYSTTGAKSLETEVEEVDSNGWSRNLKTTTVGRKVTTREMIQTDNATYCRVNRGRWTLEEDACGEGVKLAPNSGKATESYTLEKTKLNSVPVTLMRAYTVIEPENAGAKASPARLFIENKVWVSNGDLIIKREYTSGKLPDKIDSMLTESFVYNPKGLKIVRPIK